MTCTDRISGTHVAADLPAGITEPCTFPHLIEEDRQRDDLPAALSWTRQVFGALGPIQH